MSLRRPTRLLVLSLALVLSGSATLARFGAWTELSNDYSAFRREQNPAGQGDAAASRWPDYSPAAVERRRLALERFKARLQSVVSEPLSPEDAISRSVMERQIEVALEAIAFDEERIGDTPRSTSSRTEWIR